MEPLNALYYGNRAAASFMLGKYKEALEDGRTSVKLDPAYSRGYQRAAKALLTLGCTDEVLLPNCIDTRKLELRSLCFHNV